MKKQFEIESQKGEEIEILIGYENAEEWEQRLSIKKEEILNFHNYKIIDNMVICEGGFANANICDWVDEITPIYIDEFEFTYQEEIKEYLNAKKLL